LNSNIPLILTGISLVVAAIAIGVAGQTMLDVRNLDIPEQTPPFDWRATGNGTLSKWINDNFISEGEFAGHNKILNKTLTAITTDLTSLGESTSTLQNKFIIIEHQGDIPTTSSSTLAKCAGDFD